MSFEENIRNWIKLDNKIKEENEALKILKEQRMSLETNILNHVSNNNLDNAVIKINNGQLRFTNIKQTQALTYKYINECLLNCISNEEQVDLIMNFIKEQREIKEKVEIKRYSRN